MYKSTGMQIIAQRRKEEHHRQREQRAHERPKESGEGSRPQGLGIWEFPKIRGALFGVLIIRILLCRVL